MLLTYIREKEGGFLPALETFPEMLVNTGSAASKFTALANFVRLSRSD
jgi:hypothetical protein